jgi:hypothetical protein
MLRVPQHERKNTNDINSPPFVPSSSSGLALSAVEGLLGIFSSPLGNEDLTSIKTMTQETKVPVLICGGGPVGLALAIELGLRGVECLLVEQCDGTVPVPKMSQLSTRTMEFCRRWGIADQAKKAGWP